MSLGDTEFIRLMAAALEAKSRGDWDSYHRFREMAGAPPLKPSGAMVFMGDLVQGADGIYRLKEKQDVP